MMDVTVGAASPPVGPAVGPAPTAAVITSNATTAPSSSPSSSSGSRSPSSANDVFVNPRLQPATVAVRSLSPVQPLVAGESRAAGGNNTPISNQNSICSMMTGKVLDVEAVDAGVVCLILSPGKLFIETISSARRLKLFCMFPLILDRILVLSP